MEYGIPRIFRPPYARRRFYHCGIRSPSKKFFPYRDNHVSPFNWIPGALRTSNSASQHLSFSASQLSVLVSWESLAEVSKGCKEPCTKIKFFYGVSRGRCTPLHAPSTFGLLGPNARKMTQIARCFRISFHRALDEVRFSTFLIPSMKRLISDCDQLNHFVRNSWYPRIRHWFQWNQ